MAAWLPATRLGGRVGFRSLMTLATAVSVLFWRPGDAPANGRFPAVDQLVVEPGNPDHLVLRGTFGVLVSRDRGASWDFLCEGALGYKDADPALAVLPGGVILLGVPTGISRGDEAGCSFTLAEGVTTPVIDVSAVKAEPGTAIAVSVLGYVTTLWQSTDFGRTFAPLGDDIPDFTATTLDAAPGDASVIYASGLAGTTGVLLRSEDRGGRFVAFTVPGSNHVHRPYIAAIDPSDENRVYVRLEGLPGHLLVTRNGGTDFEEILVTDIPAMGFALSEDGDTIVVSNPYDGTFRADRDSLAFEKVACRGPSCLAFDGDDLYGCGDDFADGFILGRSRDRGETFERVIDLGCLQGPVGCDAESGVGLICPGEWPPVAMQTGAGVCEPRDVPADTACFAEGGADGSGGDPGGSPAGTGAGGAAAGGGAGGRDDALEPEDPGCGCRLDRGRGPALGSTLVLALGLLLARKLHGRRPHATGTGADRV